MEQCTLVFLIDGQHVWLAPKKTGPDGLRGRLNGYGGKFELEDHNNPKSCACRELREEAGIEVEPRHLYKMAVVDFYKEGEHKFKCFVYFCQEWVGVPKETDTMGRPQLYNISSMPFHLMMSADVEWVHKLLRGEQFGAQVFYTGGNQGLERPIEYGPLPR